MCFRCSVRRPGPLMVDPAGARPRSPPPGPSGRRTGRRTLGFSLHPVLRRDRRHQRTWPMLRASRQAVARLGEPGLALVWARRRPHATAAEFTASVYQTRLGDCPSPRGVCSARGARPPQPCRSTTVQESGRSGPWRADAPARSSSSQTTLGEVIADATVVSAAESASTRVTKACVRAARAGTWPTPPRGVQVPPRAGVYVPARPTAARSGRQFGGAGPVDAGR